MKVLYLLLAIAGVLGLGWLGALVYAWHHNAVLGTHYDLPVWLQVGQLIGAQTTGLIFNHSLFNTDIPWMNGIMDKFKK